MSFLHTASLRAMLSLALFGVVGVFSRYYLGLMMNKILPTLFPLNTFVINVVGSFLIGVVFVLSTERVHISPLLKLGLMTGFLGGFTTFSSYSLESALLLEKGKTALALCYFMLSPMVGLGFTFCGMFLTRKFF